MYNIPLVTGDGKSLKFGQEFKTLYQGEMRDGLIEPTDPILDYSDQTSHLYTTYDVSGGINNQRALFMNNDDAGEEYQLTDAQALQEILNTSSLNRPLTEQEKKMQLYRDQPWDERFRQALMQEAIEDRSNIFRTESQDFVNDVRKANESYFKEENLYVPRNRLNTRDTKYNINYNDPMSAGLDILIQKVKDADAQKKGEKAYRKKFTGTYPRTQSDIFRELVQYRKGEPKYEKQEDPDTYSFGSLFREILKGQL